MLFWVLVGAIVGARLFWVIGHRSELDEPLDALRVWEGGPRCSAHRRRGAGEHPEYPPLRLPFLQVLDGAVMGLAFGIAFGRIGDLIIGDHLGKPTSWLLAWQYKGGTPAGFNRAVDACSTTLQGGKHLVLTTANATLSGSGGEVLSTGTGVHQTALYDMVFATLLFLPLLSRRSRRLGVLTLTFGAWHGATRVIEDFAWTSGSSGSPGASGRADCPSSA